MQIRDWLTDPENKELLRHLTQQTIQELAPKEEVVLDEILAKYIEAAEEGEVEVDSTGRTPFSFEGESGLLLAYVIPVLAAVLVGVAIKVSLRAASGLKSDRETVESQVKSNLRASSLSLADKQKLIDTLVRVVLESIS